MRWQRTIRVFDFGKSKNFGEGNAMEVLVVGNTAYVDNDFCAKAFPGNHVKVVAAKDAHRDESSPHASWKELLQHLEQAYEFDRVVYLSNYLTPHTDTVGDIELLRSVFRTCAGRRVQLLYVAGPAGAEGAADAAGRTGKLTVTSRLATRMSLRTGIMVKAISTTGVLVVKMKDVAELAGVSSAAVSRYLNGGYISTDKGERIKQAIELTGYVRSSQARALRTGSTKLIGVIVPKINSESVSRITAGIGQVLGRRGYQMLLANTDNAADRELEYLDLFQNHPVDGIVLVATMITDEHRRAIESCRVPLVVIGQNVEGTACVYHDDYEAAFELGQALAKRAEGKIAYIGVTEEDRAAGYDRRRGIEAGLRAAGVALDPSLIRQGSFTLDSGYGAARELLSVAPDVSFIACATDTMAAGALRAIDEVRGVGEGMHRVSGFGDNAFLRALTGGIPTVHYGYLTSGVEATNMLLNTLDGVEGESGLKTLKLGHQLMNV